MLTLLLLLASKIWEKKLLGHTGKILLYFIKHLPSATLTSARSNVPLVQSTMERMVKTIFRRANWKEPSLSRKRVRLESEEKVRFIDCPLITVPYCTSWSIKLHNGQTNCPRHFQDNNSRMFLAEIFSH